MLIISDDERTVMLPAVVTSKLVSNLSEATEYAVVLSAVSLLSQPIFSIPILLFNGADRRCKAPYLDLSLFVLSGTRQS